MAHFSKLPIFRIVVKSIYVDFSYLMALVIIYISCFPLATLAQDKKEGIDQNTTVYEMTLDDILNTEVTTAAKTKQEYKDLSATVVVITAQMIKDRGYHSLEEILHDLPGFDFNKAYGVSYSTIFMRGFRSQNSDRFLLMYDGILENDIWKQTNYISRQYPVTNIKQIEVLYGPASLLYGTNAFSGIVNVITKKGDELGMLNVTASGGSFGRHNFELSHGNKVSDKVSYNITGKYFGAQDLHPWDYMILDFEKDFSSEYKENLSSPKVLLDGQLVDYALDEELPYKQYSVNASLSIGDFNISTLIWTKKESEGYWYSPYKRRGSWAQWHQGYGSVRLTHNGEISEKVTLSSDLRYRSHRILPAPDVSQKFHSTDEGDANTAGILHNDVSTYLIKYKGEGKGFATVTYYSLDVWDITLQEQVTATLSDKVSLVGGFRFIHADTQEDYNTGTREDNIADDSPRHQRKTLGAYAESTIHASDKLTFTAGGRFEINRDENKDGYEAFIPRVSAVYKASDKAVFRVQYAEAFQEADDWHKFSTVEGERPVNSATLEPEKLKSVEIGTTIKASNSFLLNASLYRSSVSNFVTSVNNTISGQGTDVGYHFENSDEKVTIMGYEVSFTGKISDKFTFNGNISGSRNENDAGELIGDMAPVKLNLGFLIRPTENLSFYPKVNMVSSRKTINHLDDPNINPIVREVDGFANVGLNINVRNTFGKIKGLDINLKIDNLLDQEYYNPGPRSADGATFNAQVLQPGFNFLAGLNYRF